MTYLTFQKPHGERAKLYSGSRKCTVAHTQARNTQTVTHRKQIKLIIKDINVETSHEDCLSFISHNNASKFLFFSCQIALSQKINDSLPLLEENITSLIFFMIKL